MAQSYDNVGLLIGNPTSDVTRVAIALEATEATIATAAAKGAQLLVVHHPPIFKPLANIDLSSPEGRVIESALRNNVAVFAAHTNFDTVEGGMNDVLAERLGLSETVPIEKTSGSTTYKLVTFVPVSHVEKVSRAIFSAGAGVIGNYAGCSFRGEGHGTFVPGDSAVPYTGRVGKPSLESEVRLEITTRKEDLSEAVRKMTEAHPYDEAAYDVYPLHTERGGAGFGRVGKLPKPMRLSDVGRMVKKKLNLSHLRFVGKAGGRVEMLAVCGGSGAFCIPLIREPERTCLVTGDVKYHDARLAEQIGLSVIDAGHFGTEILFVRAAHKSIKRALSTLDSTIKIIRISGERDPFSLLT
jgi:dinuclear metal center YbgI/SA1388 family protein